MINKIDRADARPQEVLNEIYDLFIDLDAKEDQLDFPVLYTNAKAGTATTDQRGGGEDLQPLFEAIVDTIPLPTGDASGPLQILVANLDYSDYLGRLAIARVFNGTMRTGEEVGIAKLDGSIQKTKITKLFSFSGLKRTDITETELGDIVAVAGVEGIAIGDMPDLAGLDLEPPHRKVMPFAVEGYHVPDPDLPDGDVHLAAVALDAGRPRAQADEGLDRPACAKGGPRLEQVAQQD